MLAATVMRKADELFKLLLFVGLSESKLWETYWGCLWISLPALGSGESHHQAWGPCWALWIKPKMASSAPFPRKPGLRKILCLFLFLSCFSPPSSLPHCLSFLTLGTEPRASLMLRQELYHWPVSQPETIPVTKGKVCVWGGEVNVGTFPGGGYLILSLFLGRAQRVRGESSHLWVELWLRCRR